MGERGAVQVLRVLKRDQMKANTSQSTNNQSTNQAIDQSQVTDERDRMKPNSKSTNNRSIDESNDQSQIKSSQVKSSQYKQKNRAYWPTAV